MKKNVKDIVLGIEALFIMVVLVSITACDKKEKQAETPVVEIVETKTEEIAETINNISIDNLKLNEQLLSILCRTTIEDHNLEKIKELVVLGANVCVTNRFGETALIRASQYGHLATVQYLRESGADINLQSDSGWTGMMMAAKRGDVETVQYLRESGADVNSQNNLGKTALIEASYDGHIAVITYLINEGADVNTQDKNGSGSTALMTASENGHIKIVSKLVESGADINTQDKDGDTALMYASNSDQLEVVEYLESLKEK